MRALYQACHVIERPAAMTGRVLNWRHRDVSADNWEIGFPEERDHDV